MAEFLPAYERMIRHEGGYVLHSVAGDRGGMTYAGIARNRNPQWPGWAYIDRKETPPTEWVRQFYREGYWEPIQGDQIKSQRVAENLFDFAVNGGVGVAVRLAQIVVEATPDGDLGDKTLGAINATDPELFVAHYALAKIARYRDLVTKDKTQSKFLLGWLNRALQGAAA